MKKEILSRIELAKRLLAKFDLHLHLIEEKEEKIIFRADCECYEYDDIFYICGLDFEWQAEEDDDYANIEISLEDCFDLHLEEISEESQKLAQQILAK